MEKKVEMIEKFKAFLAGAPYRMDEGQREDWIYQVAVILPNVLREWHDPAFGDDVWAKDGAYYAKARTKLAALGGFKRNCANHGEMLQALKMLVLFFEEENRKAGLGKTTRKRVELKGAGEVGGASGVRARPAERIEVLEEGAIVAMHIAKHERNPALRRACIEHWREQNGGKVMCAACGMTFGGRYGKIGAGYIEVHHLNPISQTEGVHTVDPKSDLVPLCANCHAMIHRLMASEAGLEGQAALEKLKKCLVV